MRSLVAGLLITTTLASVANANDWVEPSRQGFGQGMSPAYAQSSPDGAVSLKASVGALYLRADESVYSGDSTLSQLIWQSAAPVLRGNADVRFGGGFSLSAGGSVAGLGTSYMEDYDWLIATNNFDDWTHRSQHPDTHLDHYASAELALGYDVVRDETATIRALIGGKYTDAKWSAYGGSYIYSVNGFRDTRGNFADGAPGITYQQRLPEVFIGVDGEERYGNLTVGGMLRGGVTAFGSSVDNHWMRDLRIEDSFKIGPTFAAGLDVNYDLGRSAQLFVAARYDHNLTMRGDANYYTNSTNQISTAGTGIAGAALAAVDVSLGLKAKF